MVKALYSLMVAGMLLGPWTVQNGGHPGFTSADLLTVADAELVKRPGVTLLLVGINDALARHSFDTVSVNVRALVDKARAAGSFVMGLATTTPVMDSGLRADQHLHLAEVVNPAIRAVAAAAKVPLVDLWALLHEPPELAGLRLPSRRQPPERRGVRALVAGRFLPLLQKNDLQLPATGSARGQLLSDVSLVAWDLPARGARTEVANAGAVELLDGGNTIPFIARYRKEATGGLDEVQLRRVEARLAYLRSLAERKQAVLASIEEQGKLTGELTR